MKSRKTIGVVVGFAAVAICAEANAQFGNGDFSSGADWTLDGNVQYATVGAGGATVALFQEPGEGSVSGAGSRARIHQSFDLTGVPSIIFRYRLSVGNGTRDSSVPPASFTAALYNTGSSQRVAPDDAGDKPDFSDGFYYADADGKEEFDTAFVNVTGPDANGFKTVTLDLSGLAPTVTGRLEFGFASAANGVTSAVILDDVVSDCAASSVYCCSPSGIASVIDDGKPCTYDECQSDGSVTHDPFDCCGACDDNRPETAIMILVDAGETMPAAELTNSKNAILEMLNRMRNDPNRPYIGFGTYGEGLIGNLVREPTTDYDQVEATIPQIQQINGGPSGLGQAIDQAVAILNDPAKTPATSRKYILVFTDGWPDRPLSGPGGVDKCGADCCPGPDQSCDYCVCACPPARTAAETAADNADAMSVEIFVAHYVGLIEPNDRRFACLDASYSADVIAWLEAEIATSRNHIFKNTDVANELVDCVMTSTVELINCDDLDNCTTDSCIEGLCVHTPISGCVP